MHFSPSGLMLPHRRRVRGDLFIKFLSVVRVSVVNFLFNVKSANIIFLALLLVVGSSGCAGSANAEPTPPALHYGEDICEFCGMIISDERFAAGYITVDGQAHIFDDIGDMLLQHQQHQDEVTALFVHDYHQHTWLRAETAFYALSPNFPTPMLSGLAAFQTRAEAQALAAEFKGQVFSFAELLTYYHNNPPTPALGNFDAK